MIMFFFFGVFIFRIAERDKPDRYEFGFDQSQREQVTREIEPPFKCAIEWTG